MSHQFLIERFGIGRDPFQYERRQVEAEEAREIEFSRGGFGDVVRITI